MILLIVSYMFQFAFLIRDSYSFYLVRVFIIVLIGFEIFAGVANEIRRTSEITSTRILGEFVERDPVLGWKLKPNVHSETSIQIFESDTISIGTYSSDNVGRRISEETESYLHEKN